MSIRAIKIGYDEYGFDFVSGGWCLTNISGDLIPSKSVTFSGSAVTSVSDNSRSISFTLAPVEQLPSTNYRDLCTLIQSMTELVVYDTGTYLKITQNANNGTVTTTRDMLSAISCPCIVTSCTYNYSDANPRITFTAGLTRNYFKKHDSTPMRLTTVALAYGNRKTLNASIPYFAGEFYEYTWSRNIQVLGNTSYYTRMRFMEGDNAVVNLQGLPAGSFVLKRSGYFDIASYGTSHRGYAYNNMIDPVCDIKGIENMFSLSLPSVASGNYTSVPFQAIDTVSLTPVRYIL